MNIEILQTPQSLESIRDSWKELALANPFRQPEWLLAWWTHFQSESDILYVVVVRDEEDRVRAIAPWYRNRTAGILRFLGDGKVCTDHLTILIDPRFYDESIPSRIAAFLMEQSKRKDGWTSIHFESIDCVDPVMNAFKLAMLQHGCRFHSSTSSNTWQVELPNGWDHFLAGVSKNSRKTFRKRVADLEQVRVRWVHDHVDLEEFMPVLIELHQKRRKSLGDAGCFADARFESFLREVAKSLLQQNQLQAFSLWLGQRPIAADIGFRTRDTWLCYQAGVDPEKMELEPGKLANIYILRNAERFGIQTVDFLRGDEPYKHQLKANPSPAYDMQFSPPGLTGRIRFWGWQLKAKTRELVRQWKRK